MYGLKLMIQSARVMNQGFGRWRSPAEKTQMTPHSLNLLNRASRELWLLQIGFLGFGLKLIAALTVFEFTPSNQSREYLDREKLKVAVQ